MHNNFAIHGVESVVVEPVETVDIVEGGNAKAIWRKLLVTDTDGHKTEILFFANNTEKLTFKVREATL